jgi:hypothetical protein
MSKKHFISLAEYVKDRPAIFGHQQLQALADWLGTQSPRFKRQRWLAYIAGDCGRGGGKVRH